MQTVLLALRAISSDCNLHVNFAQCGGHYLSDVHVTTQNAKGAMVLESATQGPWLFAKLPQGRTQSWLTCMVQRNNTSRRCRQRDTQTLLLLVSGALRHRFSRLTNELKLSEQTGNDVAPYAQGSFPGGATTHQVRLRSVRVQVDTTVAVNTRRTRKYHSTREAET
jgi:hypothetical protein